MINFSRIKKSFKKQIEDYCFYRLSDCIRYPNNKFCKFYEGESCSEYHYRLWPESIAGRYSFLNNFGPLNLDLLAEIITAKYGKPEYDVTSMHLRVGDVINTPSTATKGLDTSYYLDKKWVENNSKCVYLVFGCHNHASYRNWNSTQQYISIVFNGLKEITDKPILFRTTDPDSDFVFLLFSRYYVPSRGGWNHLIKPLRSMLL